MGAQEEVGNEKDELKTFVSTLKEVLFCGGTAEL